MGCIVIRLLCLQHGQGRACDTAPCAHDKAGPCHDMVGPRPTTRPGGQAATRRWEAPRHGRARASGLAYGHLGVLLGQQAVHLVHPAYFWTQYYF